MNITRYLDSSGHMTYCTAGKVIHGDIFGDFTVTDQPADIRQVLAPVMPAAIFCIGLNYRKHAEESGAKIPSWPVVFMKQPAAVQAPGGPILLPRKLASATVDFEGELVVIIGRQCKNVSRSRALDYVLGYTCGNDVSARDWQKEFGGSQWCRGKTFDTFAPLGPVIVTRDEIHNPNALELSTTVNGAEMQRTNTGDMIFDVPTLIEFLSGSTTLMPGTVIFTGTPSGVGMARKPPVWLQPGDEVAVTITNIGTLSNRVESEIVI